MPFFRFTFEIPIMMILAFIYIRNPCHQNDLYRNHHIYHPNNPSCAGRCDFISSIQLSDIGNSWLKSIAIYSSSLPSSSLPLSVSALSWSWSFIVIVIVVFVIMIVIVVIVIIVVVIVSLWQLIMLGAMITCLMTMIMPLMMTMMTLTIMMMTSTIMMMIMTTRRLAGLAAKQRMTQSTFGRRDQNILTKL